MSVPLPNLLLGMIEHRPAHGYALKQRYDHHFRRARPLHIGQVYSTLARLERDGLIGLEGTEHDGGPDRKIFGCTESGRKMVDTWLTEPDPTGGHLQPALYAKTVVALLTGRDPAPFLAAQRASHLERMRQLTALKRDGDLTDRLLADHALFHLEADLRWIDLAVDRIGVLAAEVMG